MGKKKVRVAVFYAEGFEESEGIVPVDILRRAGIAVDTISITKKHKVISSHGIKVTTDLSWKGFAKDPDRYDAIVLPGGTEGMKNLRACSPLIEVLQRYAEAGKVTAAICAGPMVLGKAGILKDHSYVCFPGCERDKFGGTYRSEVAVVTDGTVITGRAMGASVEFGRALVRALVPDAEFGVDDGIQYPFCSPGIVM